MIYYSIAVHTKNTYFLTAGWAWAVICCPICTLLFFVIVMACVSRWPRFTLRLAATHVHDYTPAHVKARDLPPCGILGHFIVI